MTDWAGPNALLRAVKIKLGAPNYPGDTMVLKGRVTAVGGEGDQQAVEIEIGGKNGIGYHVTGSVTVALP